MVSDASDICDPLLLISAEVKSTGNGLTADKLKRRTSLLHHVRPSTPPDLHIITNSLGTMIPTILLLPTPRSSGKCAKVYCDYYSSTTDKLFISQLFTSLGLFIRTNPDLFITERL